MRLMSPMKVFPLRESIRGDCYEFLKHCDYMSGKFQKPTAMTEFYDMLGDMVMTIAFQHAGWSIESDTNQEIWHHGDGHRL